MNVAAPTYISLFAGAGGLDLSIRLALPDARCVCFVEREIPAAAILAARMRDGAIHEAPIWSDVRTFDGARWRGLVDGIIGGFPCTDLSVAGKQQGIHGEHSGLFFEYVRIIREVQPGWVYIENVPPVLAFPAGGTVLGELAKLGFDAEWSTIRASDVGAPHQRKRTFILAYRPERRLGILRQSSGSHGLADWCDAQLANTLRDDRHRPHGEGGSGWGVCEGGGTLADAERARWASARLGRNIDARGEPEAGCRAMGDTAVSRCGGWESGPRGPVRDGARWEESGGRCDAVDDAGCPERRPDDEPGSGSGEGPDRWPEAAGGTGESGRYLGNADVERADLRAPQCRPWDSTGQSGLPLFPPGPGDTDAWQRTLAERPDLAPAYASKPIGYRNLVKQLREDRWLAKGAAGRSERKRIGRILAVLIPGRDLYKTASESQFRGLADGLANRTDRLRAGGNGVVALQGAIAFRKLAERAGLK